MPSISGKPGLDPVKAVLAQRIEPLLPVAAGLHDPGFGQDPQVSRNAGLGNFHSPDDFPDRAFAGLDGLNNAKAGRVGKRLEQRYFHIHIYT